MQTFKVGMSLRYKLLLLLTALPVASLALYLMMATDLFKQDKIAYVFDSSATVSRSLGTQVRVELQSVIVTLRSFIDSYDVAAAQFSEDAKNEFQRNKKAYAMLLYRHEVDGHYTKLGTLVRENPQARAFVANENLLSLMRAQALSDQVFVRGASGVSGAIQVSMLLGERDDPNHTIAIAMYQADDMVNSFEGSGLYSAVMITHKGQLSMGNQEGADDKQLLDGVLKSRAAEGTTEALGADKKTYLISYSAVGIGEMVVVSKVDKQKALKAVEVLVAKSILFFIALIAFTLLISVIASSKLTSSLRELFEATKMIAKGDFSVRVVARSGDEVGGLADSFNLMAEEVSRLMSETAEKARMESELNTVRTVQETLFPAPDVQFGPICIRGHFEPASECGGDWWSYSRVGDKIYLWIGDATGHGAPAALITGAARSAASVIEMLPDMSPGKALSIMNRAILETSKGRIMMTFFLASIDLVEGTFTYANASHDPPYLLKRNADKLKRKDLIPLNDVNGPRLGDKADFKYEETTVPFTPGDVVFMYTDGILDIEDSAGVKWGEREFLKSLLDGVNDGAKVDQKVELLLSRMNDHRSGSALIDDVTMIMCEYERKGAA